MLLLVADVRELVGVVTFKLISCPTELAAFKFEVLTLGDKLDDDSFS